MFIQWVDYYNGQIRQCSLMHFCSVESNSSVCKLHGFWTFSFDIMEHLFHSTQKHFELSNLLVINLMSVACIHMAEISTLSLIILPKTAQLTAPDCHQYHI